VKVKLGEDEASACIASSTVSRCVTGMVYERASDVVAVAADTVVFGAEEVTKPARDCSIGARAAGLVDVDIDLATAGAAGCVTGTLDVPVYERSAPTIRRAAIEMIYVRLFMCYQQKNSAQAEFVIASYTDASPARETKI
jgi:hypothetical protein